MKTNAVSDCEREGRKAFSKHGVTGLNFHSYPRGSEQHAGFVSGFNLERFDACERALNESREYHALSVRDNAIDRAWAEKLATQSVHL